MEDASLRGMYQGVFLKEADLLHTGIFIFLKV